MSNVLVFILWLQCINIIECVSYFERLTTALPTFLEELALVESELLCLGKMPNILKINKQLGDMKSQILNKLVYKTRQKKLRELAYNIADEIRGFYIPSNVNITIEFEDELGSEQHFWEFYVMLWENQYYFYSIFNPEYIPDNYTIIMPQYIYDKPRRAGLQNDIYLVWDNVTNIFQLNMVILGTALFPFTLNKHAFINDPWKSINIMFYDSENEREYAQIMNQWRLSPKINFRIYGFRCSNSIPCQFKYISRVTDSFELHMYIANSASSNIIDISNIKLGDKNGTLSLFSITTFPIRTEVPTHLIISNSKVEYIHKIALPLNTKIAQQSLLYNIQSMHLKISSFTKKIQVLDMDPNLMDFRNLYAFSNALELSCTQCFHHEFNINLDDLQFNTNTTDIQIIILSRFASVTISTTDYRCKIFPAFIQPNKIAFCNNGTHRIKILVISNFQQNIRFIKHSNNIDITEYQPHRPTLQHLRSLFQWFCG